MLQIQDNFSNDISTVESKYLKAQSFFQKILSQTKEHRERHLDQMLSDYSTTTTTDSKEGRKAINAIKGAEKQQRMFRNIKRTLRPIRPSSVSRVDIPNDMLPFVTQTDESNPCIETSSLALQSILQRTIRIKRSQCTEEWTTLIDQRQLETAILMYNHQHFQQSKTTPFGSGTLATLIGSLGLTEACDSILDGSFLASNNIVVFPELRQFLIDLAMPHELCTDNPINTELTVEEYSMAFTKWRESTTTSTSGRHLGIHRATLDLGSVTTDMCELLNIVSRVGLAPTICGREL
jgi:hypothetical protein